MSEKMKHLLTADEVRRLLRYPATMREEFIRACAQDLLAKFPDESVEFFEALARELIRQAIETATN